ncbi:hypothetical protein J7I84_13790 [Arthrobacter sp. ISL-85]|uniref:hypothetical protein n=1 Tax=Arthrobacter sp. ISL-85 TaxID=2819115 RepID=UPI001BED0BF0|nr:hypothetical protein [Arthrobacter sp. ISL-85]MBT2567557.1 hypothetical protein [Arthrobacter sp. ISL-85]
MIDLAGLLAAAVLLITLVALEVRHVGPTPAQHSSPRPSGRATNIRVAVAVMWLLFVILLFPRVLGLLT